MPSLCEVGAKYVEHVNVMRWLFYVSPYMPRLCRYVYKAVSNGEIDNILQEIEQNNEKQQEMF